MVDPATGAVRTTVLAPASRRTDSESGRSAVLAGSTLYLFLTRRVGGRRREELFAVDTATGQVLADRDLADDVAAASQYPVGRQLGGLVARPGGGATLVFDASPTEVAEQRIPTLLTYDAGLRPVGGPVRATGLAEGAETQSVAGGVDGTVFLLVAVDDGAWILGVPDGGGAGPLLAQLDGPHLQLRARGGAGAGVGGHPARRPGPPRSTSPPGSCGGRWSWTASRSSTSGRVPRDRRRADDRRVRHPARGHPDDLVPGAVNRRADPARPAGNSQVGAVDWRRYSRCNEEDPCASRCSA